MMTKFEMKFRLGFMHNGAWSHDEIVSGEYKHVFAWLQGYLKASNYSLSEIEVLEADE